MPILYSVFSVVPTYQHSMGATYERFVSPIRARQTLAHLQRSPHFRPSRLSSLELPFKFLLQVGGINALVFNRLLFSTFGGSLCEMMPSPTLLNLWTISGIADSAFVAFSDLS